MNNRIEFRKLTPEDIEVRPAQVKDGKATLLCYIDSRSVVELMDNAVGPMNWNFELVQVGDQVVGKMGVWDEGKQTWVVKSDVGSESNIEASKGLVSSIYKRCISRWGLQDLYSIPKIVVPDDGYGNHLQVSEVSWNDKRECTHITLTNRFGKVIFEWNEGEEHPQATNESRVQMTSHKTNADILKDFCSAKKKEEGVDIDELMRFWDWYEPKVNGFNNRLKPEILWNKWCETKRN